MMYRISEICGDWPEINLGGKWAKSRPIPPPFILWRLRDAIAVFRMKADAVIWPEQEIINNEVSVGGITKSEFLEDRRELKKVLSQQRFGGNPRRG